MGYRIGIDVGGTFTDFILMDEADGGIAVFKQPSVPARPARAILDWLAADLQRHFASGSKPKANSLWTFPVL